DHRDGPTDPPRLRSGRPLPRPREEGRPRGHLGLPRAGGIARPCGRRRRGRGGVRVVGRARRPRGRPVARNLPRRSLARPPWAAGHRLVEPAAAQTRFLPLELALPDVLLLAGLLLARLPASLRVLRRPDVLPTQLPDPSRR